MPLHCNKYTFIKFPQCRICEFSEHYNDGTFICTNINTGFIPESECGNISIGEIYLSLYIEEIKEKIKHTNKRIDDIKRQINGYDSPSGEDSELGIIRDFEIEIGRVEKQSAKKIEVLEQKIENMHTIRETIADRPCNGCEYLKPDDKAIYGKCIYIPENPIYNPYGDICKKKQKEESNNLGLNTIPESLNQDLQQYVAVMTIEDNKGYIAFESANEIEAFFKRWHRWFKQGLNKKIEIVFYSESEFDIFKKTHKFGYRYKKGEVNKF